MANYTFPVPRSRGFQCTTTPIKCAHPTRKTLDMFSHALMGRIAFDDTTHELDTKFNPLDQSLDLCIPEELLDTIEDVTISDNLRRYIDWLVGSSRFASGGTITKPLTTVGATPVSANIVTVSDQDCFGFEIHVVARRTDADGEGAYWIIKGAVDRNGSTTALLGGTTKETVADDSGEVWDVTVTADDASDSLKVTVTGEVGKNISWFVSLRQVLVNG